MASGTASKPERKLRRFIGRLGEGFDCITELRGLAGGRRENGLPHVASQGKSVTV